MTDVSPANRSGRRPDVDVDELIAGYEARKPLYTERDFLLRWAQIKSASAAGITGGPAAKPPGDRIVALLASGRVSDAEYYRLAGLLGVDSGGLIYAEPAAERSFADYLRMAWRALVRAVAGLRRR